MSSQDRIAAANAALGPLPTPPLSTSMAALAPTATISAITAAGVAPPVNGGGIMTGAEDPNKRRKV